MIIAGVDPGKTGAMVTLFEDGSTIVNRVPLLSTPRPPKGGKKRAPKLAPDWVAWAREWRNSLLFNAPDVIIKEHVMARPGQGVVSMFNFGDANGFVRAVLIYADVPIHDAYPAVWKEKLDLIGMPKAASIPRALELLPSLAGELEPRRGNTQSVREGIAEAGLLAYYGRMTIRA